MRLFRYWNVFLVFTICLSAVFSSCEKRSDHDIPVVNYILPSEYQYYTVGDTIPIIFDVESKSSIKSIQIGIVKDDLTPILKTHSYNLLNGSSSGRVNFAIVLNDKFMQGGDYQILVRVENDVDQKHKYRKISIGAVDKELLGVVVITKQPNWVNVWCFDTLFNKALNTSMIGDYGGSAYLPFHNRMAICGKVKGSYTIWDIINGDTLLHFNANSNPPFPYFTGLNIVNQMFTAQYYVGSIGLRNFMGSSTNMIITTENYYPEKVFDVGDNYVSIEQHKSSPKSVMVTHIGTTGMNYSSLILKGEVIQAFHFENDDFLMFSNYNGTGQVDRYIWDNNATNNLMSYSGDEFIDVTQKDRNNSFILTESKVLWYQYSKSSITTLVDLQGSIPISIFYDQIYDNIWVANKGGFSVYSFPNGDLIFNKSINEEVLDIHLIYNR